MRVDWGVNPYDSYRYGFGYIETIRKQRAVTNSSSQIAPSNDRDLSNQAYQRILRIREAVQAIKPEKLASEGVKVSDVSSLVVESIVEENSVKSWEQNPVVNSTQVSNANSPMLTTLVGNLANAMNTLFDDSVIKGSPGAFLEGVRNDIRRAVRSWSGSEGSRFNTDFGINFDFEKTKEGVFQFSRSEQQQFESALSNPEGAASVRNELFGQDSNGLFSQLHASLTASAADLESEGGSTGLYLDISI